MEAYFKTKYKCFLKAHSTLNDWRRVSSHKAQKQSTSFSKRLSLTKLRGISAIEDDKGKPPCHTHDPILICHNKSQKTELMVLTMGDYKSSKSQTMRLTNIKTLLYRHHWNLILGILGKIMCQPSYLHIKIN